MARSRMIKPGAAKNEVLAELGPMTQFLFVILPCFADREGRMEDRPRRIKAEVFPYYDADVDAMLQELADCSEHFIQRYEIDGKRYLQITKFLEHQSPHHNEAVSELPEAPDCEVSIESLKAQERFAVPIRVARQVYTRDGNACVLCGRTDDLTLDHILPQQMSGLHVPGNLRVLCRSCNSARPVGGDSLVAELKTIGHTVDSLRELCVREAKAQPGLVRVLDKSESDTDQGSQASNKNKNKVKVTSNKNKKGDSDFENWWQHYPRKAGKAAAEKAYAKAVALVAGRYFGNEAHEAVGFLWERVLAFAASDVAKGDYCPHPATWLNQGRYDDDPATWSRGSPSRPAKEPFDAAKIMGIAQ